MVTFKLKLFEVFSFGEVKLATVALPWVTRSLPLPTSSPVPCPHWPSFCPAHATSSSPTQGCAPAFPLLALTLHLGNFWNALLVTTCHLSPHQAGSQLNCPSFTKAFHSHLCSTWPSTPSGLGPHYTLPKHPAPSRLGLTSHMLWLDQSLYSPLELSSSSQQSPQHLDQVLKGCVPSIKSHSTSCSNFCFMFASSKITLFPFPFLKFPNQILIWDRASHSLYLPRRNSALRVNIHSFTCSVNLKYWCSTHLVPGTVPSTGNTKERGTWSAWGNSQSPGECLRAFIFKMLDHLNMEESETWVSESVSAKL